MTIDDGPEVMSPSHAAALERGEDPGEPRIDHLASLVGYLRLNGDLSDAFYQRQAKRLVSVASGVREALDALVAPARGTVLRQERRQELSDEDEALERAAYHWSGYREAMQSLTAMGSRYAPKLRDEHERGADEDDRRISDERAAEKIEAPRVAS